MTSLDQSLTRFHKSSLAVCLWGFTPHEHEKAASVLSSRGHRVVRSLAAAQFVVAGPDADANLLESTRARGLDVAPWQVVLDEFESAGLLENVDSGVPLAREEVRPLFWCDDGVSMFLDVPLPEVQSGDEGDRRFIPGADRFAGLCFDQAFVDTFHSLVTGIGQSLPVALEGETSASKTTAVLYLAHRLGQAVVRLNLNGQTDAGDLAGRFVPSDRGWQFQEGALPRAMRHGYWLLLDEMNLAEPQILERLNSALELPATFVLSEGPGTVFGPGGDVEVAAGFRLLATLNPANYSGRSVLSPAFRNRWLIWHQALTPDEAGVLAMLRTFVFGEQPVVHWNGRPYRADACAPLFPQLADFRETDDLLARFARFHNTTAKAAGCQDGSDPGIGRQRLEREGFTRRNLHTTLLLAARALETGRPDPMRAFSDAIRLTYIQRYPDAADRKAMHAHLRASGLA